MPVAYRAFDIALVALMLPLALIVGGLIAIAVALDSPGPIFYRSHRIGRGGRPFAMLKFRTMVSDAAGPSISSRHDPRYTPLGRTLASTRLDELPQLWNIVKGEMRLVGPRPELEDFVREFPAQYERILSVPPGLTGAAQLQYAWEGEMLSRAQAHERLRMYRESILPLKLAIDLDYVARHGVARDLAIIVRTALLPTRRALQLVERAIGGWPGRWQLVSAGGLCAGVAVLGALMAAEGSAPL